MSPDASATQASTASLVEAADDAVAAPNTEVASTSEAVTPATTPKPLTRLPATTGVDRRSVVVLGDRILVSPPSDAERRSKGGIVIPATAASIDRKGVWGETIGVGPHVRHVDVGDDVLYVPEDAIEVDVQGDSYLIVRERDVHAVGSTRRDGATGLYL